ncbi:unnamed protein product, partial [Oppiella nova]
GAVWRLWVFIALVKISPKLFEWTGFQIIDPSVQKFFITAITSIVSRRKSEKVRQRDYLQLMIDAQNRMNTNHEELDIDDLDEEIYGKIQTTETLDINNSNKSKSTGMSDTDLIANSFLFLMAAYETSGTLLSFLFYNLAVNEKCQQKLYEEVNGLDGKYDYESVSKMPYLEACIAETLRLQPPLPVTHRHASQEYILGNILTIPKGMMVIFDIYALHHNSEYYPNPEVWDPERFMPENRDQLTPYTYMPFGTGPRNCVGMRFALMEAKTAVAHLVHKY